MGLIGAAALAPHPMVDFGLGFVIPIHAHIGIGAVITDYLPGRKFPFINKVANVTLYALTLGTIYGLYQYNTNEIGISEGVRRLWKKEKVVKTQ